MPITTSAKKALKVSQRRTTENRRQKRAVKAALKERSPRGQSLLDKAAKNKVIHRNKAARLKSLLARAILKA